MPDFDPRWDCINKHGPFPEDFEPDRCPVCGSPLSRVLGVFRYGVAKEAEKDA